MSEEKKQHLIHVVASEDLNNKVNGVIESYGFKTRAEAIRVMLNKGADLLLKK
jgi:metal-responsive CopG/Arc/MetJ family transcriptional regulator